MRTVNLNEESPTLSDLLSIARNDSVLISSKEGTKYVLEAADDFDQEIADLGNSEKFLEFLKERARESGVVSIERFVEGLGN